MSINRLLLRLSIFALLMAACAPAETQTRPQESASATPEITVPTATPILDVTETRVEPESLNSATPAPVATAQAVATSRGPNLEATDPQTVRMASGGLQLVEFFEFW